MLLVLIELIAFFTIDYTSSIVAAPSAVIAHMFLVETLRKSKPLFTAV
jgi:hypothetical protein